MWNDNVGEGFIVVVVIFLKGVDKMVKIREKNGVEVLHHCAVMAAKQKYA